MNLEREQGETGQAWYERVLNVFFASKEALVRAKAEALKEVALETKEQRQARQDAMKASPEARARAAANRPKELTT